MKIRGTAMHIAEKYTSLARDAMAAGDIVAAENYLQHAEHYNRIIMAAQAQNGAAAGFEGGNGVNGGGRFQPDTFGDADGHDEGDFDTPPQRVFPERAPSYNQHQQPQPYIPQQAFPQLQQQPQPVVPLANGAAYPLENQPAGHDGERAPRRRRRRPMAGDPKGFNGNRSATMPAGNGEGSPVDASSDDAASQ